MVVARRVVGGDGGGVESQPSAEAEYERLRHSAEAQREQQRLQMSERSARLPKAKARTCEWQQACLGSAGLGFEACAAYGVVVREGEQHWRRDARQLTVQDVRLELLQEAPAG